MERTDDAKKEQKPVYYRDGKIFFTRAFERKFFFFLTIFMLILGIMSFAGLF